MTIKQCYVIGSCYPAGNVVVSEVIVAAVGEIEEVREVEIETQMLADQMLMIKRAPARMEHNVGTSRTVNENGQNIVREVHPWRDHHDEKKTIRLPSCEIIGAKLFS